MCSAPPEAESGKLQGPVRPGGCVLTVDGPFLSVSQSSTAARWLSHLYINLNAPAGSFGDPLEGGTAAALVRHQGGDLFMSNCTLNGHNHNIRAVRMSAQPGVISTQLFTDGTTPLAPLHHGTTCSFPVHALPESFLYRAHIAYS